MARASTADGRLIDVRQPTQVRNPDATGVKTQPYAFMTSSLPVAGSALIDAPNLAEAIELASKSPCAVAYDVVEIWPLKQA